MHPALEPSMRFSLLSAATLAVLAALILPLPPAASLTTSSAAAAPVAPPRGTGETPDAGRDAPLVGTYECQGVEPDGTPYKGIVQIIPNDGTYEVVWTFATGQQYAGLGVVNGDVLAVSYFTNRPGVVAYKIEQAERGPRLQGQWTMMGAGKVFHETLTRMTREVSRRETAPEPEPKPRAPMASYLRPA
jgi:hypothetical protein